ncbi:unnamed protein product [Phaedon cochleariae]|uniref:tRNA-specific adenosine deaminase 1 n=1 Tax=Phaedon cochleariae TaxID=80249 RepID=A0A9P0GL84_PHACE|nr:unnamed protein product [Phaedon cochleariae]
METQDDFHEHIANLCIGHFKTLPKSGKPNLNEWTVLSCIVIEKDKQLELISLGTGSKCIGKVKMSKSGDILNDSHAEVMCRRSFLRFLYYQMKTESSILTFKKETKKFSIKDNIKFHFFTTHIPCGDAAIFPKQNIEEFGDFVNSPDEVPSKKRKIEDIFRTGAKCLENDPQRDAKCPGTEYHVLGVVRTKPGRGDPTLSVSCSDKMAKWCHLGIQGALLSILLEEPIYLSTLTIAGETPFCEQSLERALYKRLGNVQLQKPYQVNKMVARQTMKKFEFAKDCSRKPCSSSVSWCNINEKSLEVAVEGRRQGVTKKKLDTEAGRLKICKLELFKTFMHICESKNIQLKNDCDNWTICYGDVKNLAKCYQNSWKLVKECFKTWPCKDENLLDFSIKC